MDRNTFQALLGILGLWITRQNTRFRDRISPEKVLALGIYRLAHGNSYLSIWIERRIYTCKMHELQNANFVFLNDENNV